MDWKDKKILYARMGIAEYWIQDRARDGSIQISVFRLVQGATPAENIYPQDPVVAQEGGCPSAVLGTRLRMAESGLQLWDQVRDRWMDAGQWQAAEAVEREATVKAEGRDEGRDEGAAEELGNMAAFYTSTRFGDAVRRHAVQMPPGTRPTVLQLMLAARQLPADASAADHERNFMQFLDMQPRADGHRRAAPRGPRPHRGCAGRLKRRGLLSGRTQTHSRRTRHPSPITMATLIDSSVCLGKAPTYRLLPMPCPRAD